MSEDINGISQRIKIGRHPIRAGLELFPFAIIGFSPLLLVHFLPGEPHDFRDLLMWVAVWIGFALTGFFCPIIFIRDVHKYDWYLDGNSLIKRCKGTQAQVAKLDLGDIPYWRCRREVPPFGRYWSFTLASNDVLNEPLVLLRLGPFKLTHFRAGDRRLHYLWFVHKSDKNILLAALPPSSASNRNLKLHWPSKN